MDSFDRYVALAGVATLALVQGESGHYKLGWNASTLRGMVHAAVLLDWALKAGDLGSVHAEETTTRDAAQHVGVLRARRDGYLRTRAIRLYQETGPGGKPMSIAEIARRLDRNISTVRGWLESAGLLAPRKNRGK